MKSPAPARKPRRKVHKPHLSTASDARAVRSREQIRAAFLRLLQTTPLNEITIREICAKASLNYVTFFRHYQTKESLLEDIAADEVRQLVELTLPVFNAENTAAAAVTLCSYVDAHRKLWTTLFVGGAAESIRRTLIDLSRKVSHAHTAAEGWPPKEVAVPIFVASTVELLTWWLQQKVPAPVTEVAQIFEGFIVTPALNAAADHKLRMQKKSRRVKPKGSGGKVPDAA
ncbi:MAG TPA: TetR/AcrR family transcriptional regulator [Solimonas sp.]|nr:TetR/AcrR family transcriptional regulator [Solimonas sp.]